MIILKKIKMGISIITFFMVVVLFSCEPDVETIKLITQKEEIADYSVENTKIIYSDSSKIIMEIFAPIIMKYSSAERPYTEFAKGIKVSHFVNYPDTNSMISANYAIRWDKEEYWEAKGNVVAKNSKNEVLNTEYLIWDQKKGTISSDKQVMITTPDDVIFGDGFEADQGFNNWKIKKVKGFINIEENSTNK